MNGVILRLLEKGTKITEGNPSNGIIQATIISSNITQIYSQISLTIKIKSLNTTITIPYQLKFLIRCANDYK